MIKIGITGRNGFVGSHLSNFLNLQEEVALIDFDREFFSNESKLDQFVADCDTIVHLAAINRHDDPKVLHDTNIDLVAKLISACRRTSSTPHILISSSTQENNDSLYGQSKLRGRLLLQEWAQEEGGSTTGLVIPNVFGPFGKPHYNSFVATFCHLVASGEAPAVINDSIVKLIYVNELISSIWDLIQKPLNGQVEIEANHHYKVSEVLQKLNSFKDQYIEKGIFPSLEDKFDLALFNTFICYLPDNFYPQKLVEHTDDRGSFVEITRSMGKGQFSFSTTKPGITRGNHFHTRKAERFAVIKGEAKICTRQIGTEKVDEYYLDGEKPGYVDMKIWHTHNITNIGDSELVTLFWINESYDASDPDTYFVNV